MSEQKREGSDTDRGTERSDPLVERWRVLCEEADLPLPPSEVLQRRVRELAGQHAAARTHTGGAWPHWRPYRWLAAGIAATLLLIFLGLAVTRWSAGGSSRGPAPVAVRQQPLKAPGSDPRPAPPRPWNEHEPRLARRLSVPPTDTKRRNARSVPTRNTEKERQTLLSSPVLTRRDSQGPPVPSMRVDDLDYLNRSADHVMQQWATLSPDEWERAEAQVRRSVPVQDDFVQIPFPRVAAASGQAVAAAVEGYKREAAVVDARLFRKVTLQLKGVALEELCAALQAQTGVDLRAARGVSDEKVTVFVKERPAREVMRAIVQLFGYTWLRSKKEDRYRYELAQDLRSQLAEEELRNRDTSAALLELDRQMETYRPYLAMSFEQLQARYEQAEEPERSLLWKIVQAGGWGGMQLYYRLSAAERAALLSGRKLLFSPNAASLDRRLPAEWIHPIMRSQVEAVPPPQKPISLAEMPGAALTGLGLEIDRSELGRIRLRVVLNAVLDAKGGSSLRAGVWLADVRSPSVAKPADNTKANEAIRTQPSLQEVVSLKPESSCAEVRAGKPDRRTNLWPHVFSSDVWEAVQRASGQDVVADFYTRPYQATKVTVERVPLFEALCQVGDAMGVRWRKEGDLLLGRSTSFFWDRLKEVPNRYLERWQKAKREHGGLPLEDLIEMASLSDEQLSAGLGGRAIIHCWGLDEWHIVGNVPGYSGPRNAQGITPQPPHGELRSYTKDKHWLTRESWYPGDLHVEVRFFGTLKSEQRRRCLEPNGIAVTEFTPEQQRGFLQLWNRVVEMRERGIAYRSRMAPQQFLHARFSAEYIRASWYYWSPPWRPPVAWERVLPRVTARTAEAALAAARRVYPQAISEEIRQSPDGEFKPCIWIGSVPPVEGEQ
jgi:hypothetical protein